MVKHTSLGGGRTRLAAEFQDRQIFLFTVSIVLSMTISIHRTEFRGSASTLTQTPDFGDNRHGGAGNSCCYSMMDASKLLVRPAIEALIKVRAVHKQPDLLFRIAYSEFLEKKKMITPAAKRAGKDFSGKLESYWTTFKKAYAKQFPQHKLLEIKIRVQDLAGMTDLQHFYDTTYRIYCRFVHAVFEAIAESSHTDSYDDMAMATCAYGALTFLSLRGGQAPNMDSLRSRLKALSKTIGTRTLTPLRATSSY